MKLREIYERIDARYPKRLSDDYIAKYGGHDNSGILLLDEGAEIGGALFSLDLSLDAIAAAKEKGVEIYRTRTAGPSDAFSSMVVDLIEELVTDRQPEGLGTVTVQGCTVNGAPCAEGCCDIWSLHKPH